MVTQFGMSEKVGPVLVGETEHQVFLGREFGQHRDVSEKTAEIVDGEIKLILETAYRRATDILSNNLDTLHTMTQALLDRETLDREEVELLVQGKELPPVAPPPAIPESMPTRPPKVEKEASESGPVLGTPGAEPAGA